MSIVRECIIKALVLMPRIFWSVVEKLVSQRVTAETLESIRTRRYARQLMCHYAEEIERLREKRRCMIIDKCDYTYSYFNIAYINNMLAMILYAMYSGYVPVIRINKNSPRFNKWDWYFEQPSTVMGIDITGFEEMKADIPNHVFRPTMSLVNRTESEEFRFWQFLSRKFVKLNRETREYVEKEILNIGNPAGMLGVVLRGTDYVKLKPKGHPVQPEPEEIVSSVVQRFAQGEFSAVYVATEEKRLFDMVGAAVGEENVRENQRQYYDEEYHHSGVDLIGRVHFNRENDNYWKGIEYLSSLMILSKCKSLIAGNCGGTLFAMLMADYQDPYVFDYGVY